MRGYSHADSMQHRHAKQNLHSGSYLTHEQTPMGTHALQRKHAELNVVNGRSSQPGIATVSWDRGNQEKSINEQIPSGHTVAIFEI